MILWYRLGAKKLSESLHLLHESLLRFLLWYRLGSSEPADNIQLSLYRFRSKFWINYGVSGKGRKEIGHRQSGNDIQIFCLVRANISLSITFCEVGLCFNLDDQPTRFSSFRKESFWWSQLCDTVAPRSLKHSRHCLITRVCLNFSEPYCSMSYIFKLKYRERLWDLREERPNINDATSMWTLYKQCMVYTGDKIRIRLALGCFFLTIIY